MNKLSFTQEYFLCAVNKNGELPFLSSSDVATCLVAGGVMELARQGLVVRDEKKKFSAAKTWDGSLPYLKPLYDTVAAFKKSKGAQGIVDPYAFSLSEKPLKELVAAFRASLADCLNEVEEQGLFKDKTSYVPKPDVVTRIIEKVRAEFLEDGSIEEDVLCLAVLLNRTNLIRDYFSKVETTVMKKRIKEVQASEAYASVKDIFDYVAGVYVVLIAAT